MHPLVPRCTRTVGPARPTCLHSCHGGCRYALLGVVATCPIGSNGGSKCCQAPEDFDRQIKGSGKSKIGLSNSIDRCYLDCRCGSAGLEPVQPRSYERAETDPDHVALENRVVILDSFDNTIGRKQMVCHILTTRSNASIFAVS